MEIRLGSLLYIFGSERQKSDLTKFLTISDHFQLGDGAVDDEGDQQEEAGDASTDGVDHPQDAVGFEHQSFFCWLGNGNLNVGCG